MLTKIKAYLAGTQQEFKLIKWPTWLETRQLTLIVIGMSLAVAIFLGLFDFIFTYGLGKVIVF
jgi:preprotein translocase SecE subunit